MPRTTGGSKLRLVALLATALALALGTRDSHADDAVTVTSTGDPATALAAEDDRLARFLEVGASAARRGRVAGAALDAAMAAVTIPFGVILMTKDDPAAEITGVALLVHGGFDVLSLPFALGRTTLETLRDHYQERLARAGEPADRIAQTEREWQQAVQDQRRASIWNAALDLSLGGLEFAAGMYLLLQDDTVLGFDRRDQTVFGTILVLVTLPALSEGVWSLFGLSGIERDWDLYQTGKPRSSLVMSRPAFAVVPTRGGAAGALTVAF